MKPETILMAVGSILNVAITLTVTFTIKFSPDAATAKAALKRVLLKTWFVVMYSSVVAMFFYEALSLSPLTRPSVALMILCSISIVLGLVALIARKIQGVLRDMIEAHSKHIELTKSLAEANFRQRDTTTKT